MMLFGYQYVDPITGEFPPRTAQYARSIPKQMRRLLANRSRHDLDRAILLVNAILEDEDSKGLVLQRLQLEAKILECQESDTTLLQAELEEFPDVDSEVDLLRLATERMDLAEISPDCQFKWHELFAALALALLNIAADDEIYYGRWQDHDQWLHDWRILSHVCYWTQHAERAATFAEALKWGRLQAEQRPRIEDPVRQQYDGTISERNRLAARIRHEPTQRAILELTKFYRSGSFHSMADAVGRFCAANPILVNHLKPTNRARTLREGLSRQLRAVGHKRSDETTSAAPT